MHTFDASFILHAWDNYPFEIFPPKWEWIADQVEAGEFSIPQVALEEVAKKSSECGGWLKDSGISLLP